VHPDHAGGLTVLKQASGAELWVSGASADATSRAATTATSSCQ
jgi:glyoxylase-like metal-dependent hydrolase (beta-lactamase superfamily II)